MAAVPRGAGPGGLHHRRRAAQGRLRGDGAGPHVGARRSTASRWSSRPGGTRAGSAIAGLDVGAIMDHRTSSTRDSVSAKLRGREAAVVRHPRPSVPPRSGHRSGQPHVRAPRRSACWAAGPISTNEAAWSRDTAAAQAKGSDLEQLVWRVLSGVKQLDVNAQMSGTMKAPKLAVRSNLDEAIARAAQGGGGGGGGQGRGDGSRQGGQPGGRQGRAGEAAGRRAAGRRNQAGGRRAGAARSGGSGPAGRSSSASPAGWRRTSSCRRSSCRRSSCRG